MKKTQYWIIILLGIILSLALVGQDWALSDSTAQAGTVPTVPTIPEADETVKPVVQQTTVLTCTYGSLDPKAEKTHLVPYSQNRMAGIVNPVGSACTVATEEVCVLPVYLAPARAQLIYHREISRIWQVVSGAYNSTVSCAAKDVFYDLDRAERLIYDADQTRMGIYWYNPSQKAWELCPSTFDPAEGKYGRLSCSTTEWGYFALAAPSGKK